VSYYPPHQDPLTATFTGTKAGCFSDVIKATATYKDASFYDIVSVRVSDKELFITRVLEKSFLKKVGFGYGS